MNKAPLPLVVKDTVLQGYGTAVSARRSAPKPAHGFSPDKLIAKFLDKDQSDPNLKAYQTVFLLEPKEMISAVRHGVPATVLTVLVRDMKIPRTRLLHWIDIPEATAKRKIGKKGVLSKWEGEQALGVARLIGQVERMVQESGNPEGFDSATWLANWLSTPNQAFGGSSPGEYMDTAEGRSLVGATLGRMQSGAYA